MENSQGKWQETAEPSYDRPMGVTRLSILLLIGEADGIRAAWNAL
ncbi:hypothetical protein [Paenibacillus methanolicus]|uniref:Uncharacterized protein n=1 Tax=Paenibacillus methanolicus TaxID=582686 RepID=A0A5S5CGE7_9BACL|nr:hypothetical protein [Paenibacillus methanolicus]TYP78199.1 hypothetical protein BCM02_102776 [Paenibacillus methanolicus]